jgi:hypothetical protein
MLTGADPTLDRPMILFQYVTKGTAPVDVGSSPPEHLGFELHNRRRITGVLVGALELVRAAGRRLVARGWDLYQGSGSMGLPVPRRGQRGSHRRFPLEQKVWRGGRQAVLFTGNKATRAPRVITLDGYAASHRAVAELKAAGTLPRRVRIRSCKYLNNVIEQDHRRIKQRIRPMLGFKRFETAAVTVRGIELAAKIKKDQFNLRPLTGKPATAPELWAAVLAA